MYEVPSESHRIFVYKFSNRMSPLIECMKKRIRITISTRINKEESKKYLEIHRAWGMIYSVRVAISRSSSTAEELCSKISSRGIEIRIRSPTTRVYASYHRNFKDTTCALYSILYSSNKKREPMKLTVISIDKYLSIRNIPIHVAISCKLISSSISYRYYSVYLFEYST